MQKSSSLFWNHTAFICCQRGIHLGAITSTLWNESSPHPPADRRPVATIQEACLVLVYQGSREEWREQAFSSSSQILPCSQTSQDGGDFLRCSKTLTYHCPFPLLSALGVNLVMQKDGISFNCRSDLGFFGPLEHYGIGFLCHGSARCREPGAAAGD